MTDEQKAARTAFANWRWRGILYGCVLLAEQAKEGKAA